MDVLVHGGAGAKPRKSGERQANLDDAAARGAEATDPVTAVVTAVSLLEGSPGFNAGVGSAVQSDGRIRTSASVMTDDGTIGAACSMEGVEKAIRVAEAVRTETPHVLLGGDNAVRLADTMGIRTDVDLWTGRTRSRWTAAGFAGESFDEQLASVRETFGAGSDTVGAVATDGTRLAAGTSTGGRWFALAGRVGDVPQVGCGFYVSPAGAVSTTGAGEGIATVTMARVAEQAMAAGASPEAAARSALTEFGERADGTAGLIVLSPDGERGVAYSSETMQTATAAG